MMSGTWSYRDVYISCQPGHRRARVVSATATRRIIGHMPRGPRPPVNSLAYPAHVRDNPAACTLLGG
eukprot:1857563-Prymnesium_polylepis.1